MICFKDKTFCDYFKECRDGNSCQDALTDEVKKEAIRWWGSEEAPIARLANKPECFKEKCDA